MWRDEHDLGLRAKGSTDHFLKDGPRSKSVDMSKKACGMKDNFPRQIPWRFGLTTITKVHYQSNKRGDEYEFGPRAKSPIDHFLKDGSGPRVWMSKEVCGMKYNSLGWIL